jgi:hypothetical protein
VLVAPGTFAALTFHWYEGDRPPLVGVAEKFTEVPAQTVVADAEIETLTGRFGLTVIITVFEIAGLPVAQVALEVNWQVIASEFIGTKE